MVKSLTTKMLSVELPISIHLELQEYVFKKRMSELPDRTTTVKGTVAQAIKYFLDSQEETQ